MQVYHMCDLGKISESERKKSERDLQNGDDIDLLTRSSFYLPRKALEIFHGASPVMDRRFNICL